MYRVMEPERVRTIIKGNIRKRTQVPVSPPRLEKQVFPYRRSRTTRWSGKVSPPENHHPNDSRDRLSVRSELFPDGYGSLLLVDSGSLTEGGLHMSSVMVPWQKTLFVVEITFQMVVPLYPVVSLDRVVRPQISVQNFCFSSLLLLSFYVPLCQTNPMCLSVTVQELGIQVSRCLVPWGVKN